MESELIQDMNTGSDGDVPLGSVTADVLNNYRLLSEKCDKENA